MRTPGIRLHKKTAVCC